MIIEGVTVWVGVIVFRVPVLEFVMFATALAVIELEMAQRTIDLTVFYNLQNRIGPSQKFQ